jgi:hypothetical protein
MLQDGSSDWGDIFFSQAFVFVCVHEHYGGSVRAAKALEEISHASAASRSEIAMKAIAKARRALERGDQICGPTVKSGLER